MRLEKVVENSQPLQNKEDMYADMAELMGILADEK